MNLIKIGYPMPRIIWMRDNVPLGNTTRITLQNDGSLIIHPYKRDDAGRKSNNWFYKNYCHYQNQNIEILTGSLSIKSSKYD